MMSARDFLTPLNIVVIRMTARAIRCCCFRMFPASCS